jgi:hypothetical protein
MVLVCKSPLGLIKVAQKVKCALLNQPAAVMAAGHHPAPAAGSRVRRLGMSEQVQKKAPLFKRCFSGAVF